MTAPLHPARFRAAVIALAWLVLVPIAIIVPTTPAQAATPATDTWSAELDFGERVSETGQVGLRSVQLAFLEPEVNCELYAEHVDCGGGGAPAAPAPDRVAIQAEALAAAEDLMRDKLTSVAWEMSPESDQLQIVNLDSYLAADVDWYETEETKATRGPLGWEVEVTVKATPHKSMWTFTELGDTARVDVVECYNSGNLFDDNNIVPPACPKVWDHSSDITGDVKVEYALEYNVTWSSTILHAGTSGPWTITSDTIEEVTVSEVQAFGWSPKNNHEDGGGCGGFWGWACKVVKVVAEVGLKVVYALAPWIEPFVDFLKGCSAAVIEQLGGLVNIAKEAYAAVTDTGAFIDEKVGLLQDMFAAAKADPDGFVAEVALGIVDADYFAENGKVAGVSKLLCSLAIEYLSGKAFASLAQKFEKFLGRKRDRNGNLCRVSSFPADTLVLMADGTHRRIDTVRPGDWVLSHNLDTSVWEPKLVVDQWSHHDRGPPATLTLADEGTVTATADHLFWVENNAAWTQLQWVQPGDQLLTPAGPVAVDGITVGPRHGWRVWELTVEDNHNFTVLAGENNLLVHNCGHADIAGGNANAARNHPEVGKGRTAGGGSGEVNGQPLDYQSASGEHNINGFVDPPSDPVFDTIAELDADFDAEYKIMEQAAADIDEMLFPDGPRPGPGEVLPDADGTIRIVVDSPPGAVCESCASVIDQFRDRYPNVDIIVEDVVGGAP